VSAPDPAVTAATPRAAQIGLSIGGLAVALVAVVGSVTAAAVVLFALLGTPLFAIMGGSAEIL
jgi:hypothetical protein